MSITLVNSDFQYLQDQLVELKSKNYELAEKNRRGQADFEAAKAKICNLQLKLEEQERDFQVTSTTLRREIEVVAGNGPDKENNDDYKTKYKKVLIKAKELQTRFEKSVEIAQQLDSKNKELEQQNAKLAEEISSREVQYEARLKEAIQHLESSKLDESESLDSATKERDTLKHQLDNANLELAKIKSKLESQAEERKIYERKGMQVVKELKRQLTQEKNRADTLQKRMEELLSQPPPTTPSCDTGGTKGRLSNSSSTNGCGSRANQEITSVGSWSFVTPKSKLSNAALNETMSLCSIDSEDRETVQQPRDTNSEDSLQRNASITSETSRQDKSSTNSDNVQPKQAASPAPSIHSSLSAAAHTSTSSSQQTNEVILLEEQAALVDRLTKMQHEKWQLEEKLSYLEQANSALSEDLANKSHVIQSYFLSQASRATQADADHNVSSRRTSFPSNINHLLSEKPSLKKVVDFLRERSVESDRLSKEAARKMQIMLEETLIKCIKLQENLDHVTNELNTCRN